MRKEQQKLVALIKRSRGQVDSIERSLTGGDDENAVLCGAIDRWVRSLWVCLSASVGPKGPSGSIDWPLPPKATPFW